MFLHRVYCFNVVAHRYISSPWNITSQQNQHSFSFRRAIYPQTKIPKWLLEISHLFFFGSKFFLKFQIFRALNIYVIFENIFTSVDPLTKISVQLMDSKKKKKSLPQLLFLVLKEPFSCDTWKWKMTWTSRWFEIFLNKKNNSLVFFSLFSMNVENLNRRL